MDSSQASTLLVLFSPLLRKSAKIVPEKVKVNLMKIIGDLMCLIPDLRDARLQPIRRPILYSLQVSYSSLLDLIQVLYQLYINFSSIHIN